MVGGGRADWCSKEAVGDAPWTRVVISVRSYLELALLALLDHRGVYINRIEHLTNHGLEWVPWATTDDMRANDEP